MILLLCWKHCCLLNLGSLCSPCFALAHLTYSNDSLRRNLFLLRICANVNISLPSKLTPGCHVTLIICISEVTILINSLPALVVRVRVRLRRSGWIGKQQQQLNQSDYFALCSQQFWQPGKSCVCVCVTESEELHWQHLYTGELVTANKSDRKKHANMQGSVKMTSRGSCAFKWKFKKYIWLKLKIRSISPFT